MTLASGTRLGPYEVVEPAGVGGMGEVYRGTDTRLQRVVALKILPTHLSSNPELRERFDREARAISSITHPHICTLYDVGHHDGTDYLVMEFVEGESLDERLKKGPLPMEQVLRYGAEIADALDKAHRHGITHRDLKPSNIMVTKSGAKLLDFGLAKITNQHEPVLQLSHLPTAQRQLTQEGTILGTFQYMAPEQLEGSEVDARTDIFAFGAVLYEMATGRRAFEGKTKTSLIAAIVDRDPPPISSNQPLTPPALEHLVRKCLAKDPDDRWQSAHDIAEELKWISAAGSQAGVAAPVLARRKTRERLGWAVALIVALAAVAFAAHRMWPVPKPTYRFAIPMIDANYKLGQRPVLSPDGRTLYFIATSPEGYTQLFRRRLDEFAATPLAGTEHVSPTLPVIVSADGRTLNMTFAGAILKRVSVDGGPVQMIADGLEGGIGPSTGMTIARDGTTLLGGTSQVHGIRRLMPGGVVQWIFKSDDPHSEAFLFPLFLPDGKRYLFVAEKKDARGTITRILCASKLGTTEITRIGEVKSRVEYARGHVFDVREGTLMAQPFDEASLKFTGEAIPVVENVTHNSGYGTAEFSVASDGTIAAQTVRASSHLLWVDALGKKNSPVDTTSYIGSFTLIPGSDRVVVSANDARAGVASLWIRELNRNASTRPTFSPAQEVYPLVSPDGTKLFFTSDLKLNEMPLNGTEPPRQIVSASAGIQIANSVSADGRFLLYSSNEHQRETAQDLWVLPLTGNAKPFPYLVTPKVEWRGTFSPDGKWVAYQSNAPGTDQVYVRPFPGPGSARPVSSKGGATPRFSPDGKKIYFADGGKLMVADFRADGSLSEPSVAFELDETITQFEPMRDGRFLMLLSKDSDASPPVRIITNWQPSAAMAR